MLKNHEELHMIAVREFIENKDMYLVVDFLNKNLKQKGLVFGLTRKDGKDIIAIYDSGIIKDQHKNE